ncbi:malate dehydrogenase (oxaloacetate-decarboxylating)(NADP+), partial [Phenoliferia sp. Uapishka_3]
MVSINDKHTTGLAGGAQPCHVGSNEMQVERALARLRSIPGDLEKYTFLAGLKERNETIFYALVGGNMKECTPLIYTPVIGLACQNFSLIHPAPNTASNAPASALYLSAPDLDNLPQIIKDLKTRLPKEEMEICVVTDGSRVLGLGDLGVGGMGISMGKLSLYVAAGGVNPKATLPIVLDLGTDNERLLADPLYVGLRQRRMADAEAEEFVAVFMKEMHKNFPNIIIQFEDFHTTLAFPVLAKHRDVYPCFNDDIQGTGAVVLAGAIRAFALNGKALKDQKILFFGAGSSGVGVAETICRYFVLNGISEQDAKNMFWLVDSKGLVSNNRGDTLPEHKRFLARTSPNEPILKTLESVVRHVRPTALLGLSTVGGTFTKEILQFMAEINEKPIVFALSNPVAQAECTFEEAVEGTGGTVMYASGSPFDPVVYQEKLREPGQGNNMYIFPGLGLGAILAQVKTIPEEMVHASAQALATSLTADEQYRNLLYPDVTRIREVSIRIAVGVIRSAQKLNVDKNEKLRSMSDEQLEKFVRDQMYHPLLAVK